MQTLSGKTWGEDIEIIATDRNSTRVIRWDALVDSTNDRKPYEDGVLAGGRAAKAGRARTNDLTVRREPAGLGKEKRRRDIQQRRV